MNTPDEATPLDTDLDDFDLHAAAVEPSIDRRPKPHDVAWLVSKDYMVPIATAKAWLAEMDFTDQQQGGQENN
jgi:hypothetical protein